MIAWLPLLLLAFWPIPQHAGITGTFMEYRNRHLHAGFDLSTNGQVGLPVRCFDDGAIIRIKVQKRGYGRVLYVLHPTRHLVSVYAHLDKFLPAAEELVQQARKARHTKYPGTIVPPRPIPVQAGQTIAWTGESGVGWPHLHFELRNDRNEPVNPALYGFQVTHDSEHPTFRVLHFYPESPETRINGACRATSVPVRSGENSGFFTDPAHVSGDVKLSVGLDDSDGKKGPLAIHTLTATLNGEPWYSFTADTFSFDHYKQSGAIYDLGATRLTPSAYAYNLFRIPGATVEGQRQQDTPFRRGSNRLTVTAEDFAGNRSTLVVPIFWTPAGAPAASPRFPGRTLSANGHTGASAPSRIVMDGTEWIAVTYGQQTTRLTIGKADIAMSGYNAHARMAYLRQVPPPATVPGLVMVPATTFRLMPGLLFLADLSLRFQSRHRDESAGWYRYDAVKKKWRYLDSEWTRGTENGAWLAHDFRPGVYGVLLDHARPVIVGNPRYFRNRTVWEIRDEGKGVDDRRIVLSNGRKVWQMEYDPDRKLAWIDRRLPPGRYTIAVADLAGNRASARGRLRR